MKTISRRIQSCFEQIKKDAMVLSNFSISPNAPLRKEDRGMASHRLGISKVKEWFSMRRISMTFLFDAPRKVGSVKIISFG